MSRRSASAIATAVVVTLAAAGCSGNVRVTDLDLPEGLAPEPGVEIPEITIDAGWSPIGDGLIPVVGERLGFFEDAGISFSRPSGLKSDLLTSMTPILNGQVDVGNTYIPLLTAQMSTVRSVTTFALPTTSHVQRILAPAGEYETLDGLMAEGMSFEEAAPRVMSQMEGGRFLMFTGIDPQFYQIALGLADLSLDDVHTSYMGDPDMVTAAHSGRGDFASPNGAVQVEQLQSSGWEPIITITDLIEHMPEETLNMANTYTGFVTTKQFANENYNTLLRFTGVLFRIAREFDEDPVAACDVYVDYVNSYTGSAMTADDCAGLYDGIYELNDFETYGDVVGPEATVGSDYLAETDAQIARLVEQEVLPDEGLASTDISLAHEIHRDLVAYRDLARELLADAPESDLAERAQQNFEDFNYLDAYRLAKAAAEGDGR